MWATSQLIQLGGAIGSQLRDAFIRGLPGGFAERDPATSVSAKRTTRSRAGDRDHKSMIFKTEWGEGIFNNKIYKLTETDRFAFNEVGKMPMPIPPRPGRPPPPAPAPGLAPRAPAGPLIVQGLTPDPADVDTDPGEEEEPVYEPDSPSASESDEEPPRAPNLEEVEMDIDEPRAPRFDLAEWRRDREREARNRELDELENVPDIDTPEGPAPAPAFDLAEWRKSRRAFERLVAEADARARGARPVRDLRPDLTEVDMDWDPFEEEEPDLPPDIQGPGVRLDLGAPVRRVLVAAPREGPVTRSKTRRLRRQALEDEYERLSEQPFTRANARKMERLGILIRRGGSAHWYNFRFP